MRYCRINTVSNGTTYTFYGQFDNLLSYDEVEYYISKAIEDNVEDVQSSDVEEIDLSDILSLEETKDFSCEEMTADDWINEVVSDYEHVRPVLSLSVLGDPLDGMVAIYKKYKESIINEPQYLYIMGEINAVEAECKYSNTDKVDSENSYIKVVDKNWKDILQRMKRDSNIGGGFIKTGILTVFDISEEDYIRNKKNTELTF